MNTPAHTHETTKTDAVSPLPNRSRMSKTGDRKSNDARRFVSRSGEHEELDEELDTVVWLSTN
jgi:hypothetical protein